MNDWQETRTGFIREKPDGTLERHPHKYVAHEEYTFRATYDPATGRCTGVEPSAQHAYLRVEDTTGEIKEFNLGFSQHHELTGKSPLDAQSGHTIIKLIASSRCPHCNSVLNKRREEIVPPDFIRDVTYEAITQNAAGIETNRETIAGRKIAYKWDLTAGRFIPKTAAELAAPVIKRIGG